MCCVPVLVVGLLFQGIALAAGRGDRRSIPLPPPEMVLVANINLFFFGMLMLSRAMTAAIDVMYARGDVDFLLASPIPPGRVLAVRMIGVAAEHRRTLAAAGRRAGQRAWRCSGRLGAGDLPDAAAPRPAGGGLGLRPGGGAGGAGSAPAAARRIGHMLALVMGVVIFALGQAPRFMPRPELARFWAALLPARGCAPRIHASRAGLLGQPGAARRQPSPSAWPCFCLVWATLGGKFAAGVITAAAYRPPGAADRQSGSSAPPPFAALVVKNLRLLARFPGIVTQTVYRSLTLVPWS